jgi:hypothetical protein
LIKAIDINGVDGAGFHIVILPVIIDNAKFQKYTAQGKLNAEMTATIPRGFHCSRI